MTDKERLEEIKHYWYIENMIDKEDVEWLIKQTNKFERFKNVANECLERMNGQGYSKSYVYHKLLEVVNDD